MNTRKRWKVEELVRRSVGNRESGSEVSGQAGRERESL